MQIFYSNIRAEGDQAVTSSERREMRNAIIDYGALQPDPVLQPYEESNDEQVRGPSQNRSNISHTKTECHRRRNRPSIIGIGLWPRPAQFHRPGRH